MVNCFLEINQPYNAPRVIVSFHSTHPRVKQFQCLIVFFIHHSTHPRIVPRGDCKMYSVPGATQPNLAPEIEIKVYTLLLLRILVLNIQQLFFAVLFYLQKKILKEFWVFVWIRLKRRFSINYSYFLYLSHESQRDCFVVDHSIQYQPKEILARRNTQKALWWFCRSY